MRLTLARGAGEHEDLASRIDAHANTFVGPEPGVFDEERQSYAEPAPFSACPLLLRAHAVPAHCLDEPPQAFRIVAAVVAARATIA